MDLILKTQGGNITVKPKHDELNVDSGHKE